jgi:hypothetical protein
VVKNAIELCDSYPMVGHYMRKFHGADVFERAIGDLTQQIKKANSSAPDVLRRPELRGDHSGLSSLNNIEFHTRPQPWMSDKQAVELAKKGYFVEDSRPFEKLSAVAERSTERLQNPTQTGIYELLTRGGKFERCLIIVGPKGQREDKRTAIAIKAEGDGYATAETKKMFVRLPGESYEEFRDWLDGKEWKCRVRDPVTFL